MIAKWRVDRGLKAVIFNLCGYFYGWCIFIGQFYFNHARILIFDIWLDI